MAIAPQLTGQTFGRLTVLYRTGTTADRQALWLCRCSCGGTKTATTKGLRNGTVQSCGCLRREHCATMGPLAMKARNAQADHQRAACGVLWNNYRRRCEGREIVFEIDRDTFQKLVLSPCVYCESEPAQRMQYRSFELHYTGIDRIDPSVGYVVGNIVPACWRCNRSKGNGSVQELLDWARRLALREPSAVIEAVSRLKARI